MIKNKFLGLLAAVSFALPAVAAPTLINNGGFENGLVSWSCTGADLCQTNSGYAHSGALGLVGFDNSGFATLSQTISTTAGLGYDFSFWARRSDPVNGLRYQIDSGTIFTVAYTASFAQTLTTFTATGSSSTVKFFFDTDPGTGIVALDDVFVAANGTGAAALPEPAGVALVGVALLGLCAARRTRRK